MVRRKPRRFRGSTSHLYRKLYTCKKVEGARGSKSPEAPLTFDRCEQIALGLLGYNYSEYLDLTPRSLNNAVAGFSEKREAESRELWEVMRSQTVTLVNLQLPKGKRVKPKELYKFPWDNTQKAGPKLTKAEAKAILAKWQKRAT